MSKAKTSKKQGVELGPDSDPKVLYTTYVKECKSIAIEPSNQLKAALTNEENANLGKQIIVVGTEEEKLGPGGCRAFVNAVVNQQVPFTAIKDIRLCRSNIKDAGAAALASLLSATATKKSIDTPSDPSAPQLLDWKLEYLELNNNDIGSEGARSLGRSLCVGMNRTLTTLVLDFNPLGSDGVAALCKGLSTNSTLQKLSLKHCNIDEVGGRPIGEMLSFKKSQLVSLDLTSNMIGGSGLIAFCDGLGANASLKTLRLGDNSISCQTDDDARALSSFADVLVKHPSLLAIDLLHNKIGTNGGKLLIPAVRDNKQITEFKVDAKMDDEVFKLLFRVSTTSKKKPSKGKKSKKK